MMRPIEVEGIETPISIASVGAKSVCSTDSTSDNFLKKNLAAFKQYRNVISSSNTTKGKQLASLQISRSYSKSYIHLKTTTKLIDVANHFPTTACKHFLTISNEKIISYSRFSLV